MSFPRITPFKSQTDITQLADLFYSPDHADQRRALALVKAYQVRAPLPASVHLTGLVVSAFHADIPSNDLYAIRQTYAMALIRMVNEILDSHQTGKMAAPLHLLAREVNLPSSFVELRHAATHEDLPTIYLLRDLAQRAMNWLWDNFWSKNTRATESLPPDNVQTGPVSSDSIKETLREWRRSRRADPEGPLNAENDKIAAQLNTYFDQEPQGFLDVLFSRNILIPTGSMSPAKKAASAIVLWGPLFTAMRPSFEEALVTSLIEARNKEDWPSVIKTDSINDAYQLWLNFLVPRAGEYVVSLLGALPRPWNAKLLAQYGKSKFSQRALEFSQDMAEFTGVKLDLSDSQASQPETNGQRGWVKVADWTPRPLGII